MSRSSLVSDLAGRGPLGGAGPAVGGAVAVPLDIEFSGPDVDKQPAFVQVNNPSDAGSRFARR
jgi:hypothetical protein